MEKLSISSEEETRDRLSEFPDSLIYEIFWLLPMNDVVQTTILSKRWNNLWTTTPYLNFDNQNSTFVNRDLILWRGFKILKFKFSYRCFRNINMKSLPLVSDMDSWVHLAKDYGVEELYFYIAYSIYDDDGYFPDDDTFPEFYRVPDILYSCASLKVLSLKGCKLQIHGNVHWKQLSSLWTGNVFVDEHSINRIVSGSPQLEVFDLNVCDCDENLNILSSSLKKLSSKWSIVCLKEDQSTTPELRIWSPNLETLDFSVMPYAKYSLMNVSSLSDLTVDFYHVDEINDLYGEPFGQIFPSIPHVEKLTIAGWCIKLLGGMKDKHLLSQLSNAKFLKINKDNDVEYEEIMDILQAFPQLKTLVLHSIHSRFPANHPGSFVHVERNHPESFLLQLRTIEITCSKDDKLDISVYRDSIETC